MDDHARLKRPRPAGDNDAPSTSVPKKLMTQKVTDAHEALFESSVPAGNGKRPRQPDLADIPHEISLKKHKGAHVLAPGDFYEHSYSSPAIQDSAIQSSTGQSVTSHTITKTAIKSAQNSDSPALTTPQQPKPQQPKGDSVRMQELKRQHEEAKKAQQQKVDVNALLTKYDKPKSQEQLAKEAEDLAWITEHEKRQKPWKPFDYSSEEAVDILQQWKVENRDQWPEEGDDPEPYAYFNKRPDNEGFTDFPDDDDDDDWEYPTDDEIAQGMNAGGLDFLKAIARHNEEEEKKESQQEDGETPQEDGETPQEDGETHQTPITSFNGTSFIDTSFNGPDDHQAASDFQRDMGFLKTITPEVEETFGVFESSDSFTEEAKEATSETPLQQQASHGAFEGTQEDILPEDVQEDAFDLDTMIAENTNFMTSNGHGVTDEDITQFALDSSALVAGNADAEVNKRETDALKKKQEFERQEYEKQELQRQELQRQELQRQEFERQEFERQEFERQEFERQEFERQEFERQAIQKQQLEANLAQERQKEADENARRGEYERHQRMIQRAQQLQQVQHNNPPQQMHAVQQMQRFQQMHAAQQMSPARLIPPAQQMQSPQQMQPAQQMRPAPQRSPVQQMQPSAFQQPRSSPSSTSQGTIPSPMITPAMPPQQQYPPNAQFFPRQMAQPPMGLLASPALGRTSSGFSMQTPGMVPTALPPQQQSGQPVTIAPGLPIPSPHVPHVAQWEIDAIQNINPGQPRHMIEGFLVTQKLKAARAAKPPPPSPTYFPPPPSPHHQPQPSGAGQPPLAPVPPQQQVQAHRAAGLQPAQPLPPDMLPQSDAARASVAAGWRIIGLGRTAREGFTLAEGRALDRGIQVSLTERELSEIKSHMSKDDATKMHKCVRGKQLADQRKLEKATAKTQWS
ncbi:hypothetical protein K491DRAFT_782367 [Lophiostoma macrostomum CBS 122681]|uniref:Uncharacterized protein n=1 Tax=Lophiostoma macrostomum CBS 122681 TaxID=1314788 RepID=A0A6A6SWG5_9PLEO|nr:hypothetical protein K491DRAFT_782367 [Lophiostoma macrostomum CBS 122681]